MTGTRRPQGMRRWSAAPVLALLAGAAIGHAGVNAQEATFYSGPVAPLTAAVWNEQVDEVRRLLAEGADPNRAEGKPSITPWQVAVMTGHLPSLDLFASHVDRRPSSHYTTTLFKAALQRGDARLVSAFIRGGTLLDFTDTEYSPLALAAASGYDDVMQVLLRAGVSIDAQNHFGDTALMAAVRSGRLEAVQLLLDRGANVRLVDRDGRDALAWAERMGRPSIVKALRGRGAVPTPGAEFGARRPAAPVRTSAARALVLLEESGSTWIERKGCASCHHQGLLVPVAAVAQRQGFVVREDLARAQEVRLRSMLSSMEAGMRSAAEGQDGPVRFSLGFFGQATSGYAWLLSGLASATGKPRPVEESAALTLARTQLPNGRWRVGAPRVPIQESDIQTTALVIRVLLTFAPAHPETSSRVERARAWLLSSAAGSAHDRAYRLLGLRWAGADPADVKDAMKALVKEQTEDGGWAQLTGLNPDAYATGLALVALREGADMPSAHRAYQRGVAYLLRTQEHGGSWLVHKRAASINPYFESGFPHGLHQFSSFAGTAWATMALMYAAEPPTP
jgi:Ankyrin repeats (3 copies)/Squalene-hopene cyclase C-terminal domain